MEKACRTIIDDIINGKISTRRELEVEKRQLCRDLKLSRFMSNADILEFAKPEEKEIVSEIKVEDEKGNGESAFVINPALEDETEFTL